MANKSNEEVSVVEKKDEGEDEKKEEYKGLKPVNNGSVTDTYNWTQPVITEIIVNVPIESGIRGKDVTVKYTSKTLFVQIKGSEKALIDGEFCKPVQVQSIIKI